VDDNAEDRAAQRKAYARLIKELMVRYRNFVKEQESNKAATADDVEEIGEELSELRSRLTSLVSKLMKENKHKGSDEDFKKSGSPSSATSPSVMANSPHARILSFSEDEITPDDDTFGTPKVGGNIPKRLSSDSKLPPPPPPPPTGTGYNSPPRKHSSPIKTRISSSNVVPAIPQPPPQKKRSSQLNIPPPLPPTPPQNVNQRSGPQGIQKYSFKAPPKPK